MCGIVGGVGKLNLREYLLEGLEKLEYRGYDSAGMAYFLSGEVIVQKISGRVSSLAQIVPTDITPTAGIAHTRWATHGQPNSINAHPHQSNKKLFTVVHNGVIENFRALGNQLRARGYRFDSETDTEILANVLERLYLRSGSVMEALAQTIEVLEGSFACGILFAKEPNRVYFMKRSSPMLIGVLPEASFLASDALPMMNYTNEFVETDDDDYGYLEAGKLVIYNKRKRKNPVFVPRSADLYSGEKEGYPHFMLKEMEEIPATLRRLCDNYFAEGKFLFNENLMQAFHKTKRIHFLACGTSYYAAKMGAKFLRPLGKDVLVSIASEWAYDPYDVSEDTIFFFISQSGETADLIRCLKIINDRGGISVALTNAKGSNIDRAAIFSLLLYAGIERAVASTKSYVAQICLLYLLTAALEDRPEALLDIDRVVDALHDVIRRKDALRAIAERVKDAKDAFLVGRGCDYLACLEGSLKLKEVSYIHAEAYPAGELKHGPIALIEDKTPVFGLISDPYVASATRNNFEELASRGAEILVFSQASVSAKTDAFITKDVVPSLAECVLVVALQYIAYYIALFNDYPIDNPRNLAKSVTVE